MQNFHDVDTNTGFPSLVYYFMEPKVQLNEETFEDLFVTTTRSKNSKNKEPFEHGLKLVSLHKVCIVNIGEPNPVRENTDLHKPCKYSDSPTSPGKNVTYFAYLCLENQLPSLQII